MELERYKALLCAIDTGSLSSAAEKLGYTPSGISRMMAALEEENGFSLLLRCREGVRPTPECERMLPVIREMLYSGEACRQLAARIRGMETGTVVVGTAYSAYYVWLSKVISEFHLQYPSIQVQICSGYSTQLVSMMIERQLDLCIISRREGDYEWLPIEEDPLVAWVPETHRLSKLDAVPVGAFETEPYIDTYPGMDVDNARLFREYKVQPNTQFSTMDSYATYSMVEAGLGISMNNRLNGQDWTGGVKILPLEPPKTIEIGMASLKNAAPAARRLVTFVQEELRVKRDADAPSSFFLEKLPKTSRNTKNAATLYKKGIDE